MAREKAGYRENLELLKERMPDKTMLSVGDVLKVTGLTYKTVHKIVDFGGKRYISLCDLARQISI